jgi:adenylyl cyclase-associated protein
MEAKDTLNRSKEGREWGACLSVVGEGVGAWGWVQVVCLFSIYKVGWKG